MTPRTPVPVMLMVRALDLGGSERQMSVMARGLDPERFAVHVGCFVDQGLRRQELESSKIPLVRFPVTSFKSPAVLLRGAAAFRSYLRRHGIRLVHGFDWPTCVFSVPLLWGSRKVVALSSQRSHRALIPEARRLMRFTDRLARAIVVNSDQIRRHLIADEGVPDERIRLCYNGIDVDTFRPPAERLRSGPLAGASLVIGVVCGLRPEKDLATLLRAFAALQRPEARLLLVGEGTSRPELEGLSRDLGIAEQTIFAGAQRDVLPWLHPIDIFVLPSTSEALSNSLMEAMACGCACVASRVGGNPELIEHDHTGLLFEAQDAAGLTSHLAALAGNADLRGRLGKEAAARMVREFSIPASAARLGEIYSEMCRGDQWSGRPGQGN